MRLLKKELISTPLSYMRPSTTTKTTTTAITIEHKSVTHVLVEAKAIIHGRIIV